MSQWKSYNFSVDGVNFISKIDTGSTQFLQIESLPEGVFNSFNVGAIREYVGDVAEYSLSEIKDILDHVNQGSSWAVLELA